MVSLKNIITHILQAHGFDVFQKDGIIHGEKEGFPVSVGIFDEPTVRELRKHAELVSKEEGRHIVCFPEANDTAEEEASNLGFTVWKKSDLEREIGNAIIMQIGESRDMTFKELVQSRPEEHGCPPIRIENLGTEGRPLVVKSKLTSEDVKEIAEKTIQGFKYELELVPHYLFRFSCNYHGMDGRNIERDGTISVNALTGRCAEWEHQPEADSASEHIIQLEPKIDQDNAEKIAIHAIIALNTEFKEVIVERDHATIIEKTSFGPDEDSVILEDRSIIMLPVWCAEGKHGVMILDGITGKVISEDYYDSR